MVISQYVAVNPANEEIAITIELGLPEPDDGDFKCMLNITGLDVNENIYGVDAIQSYSLGVKRLKMLFEERVADGWKFYFPNHVDSGMEIDFSRGFF